MKPKRKGSFQVFVFCPKSLPFRIMAGKSLTFGQITHGASPDLIQSGSHEISIFLFLQHSQITTTRHPASTSVFMARLSLAIFSENFFCHFSWLVCGLVEYLHSQCLCQKHPFTKMTVLYLARTISGLIFRIFEFRRYLKPWEWINFLNSISGLVFFERIPAIILERVVKETMSIYNLSNF